MADEAYEIDWSPEAKELLGMPVANNRYTVVWRQDEKVAHVKATGAPAPDYWNR